MSLHVCYDGKNGIIQAISQFQSRNPIRVEGKIFVLKQDQDKGKDKDQNQDQYQDNGQGQP